MAKEKIKKVYVVSILDKETMQYVPECASFDKEKAVGYVKKKSNEWLWDKVDWLE